jgi:NADH-quinone oxidoreductase subunit J
VGLNDLLFCGLAAFALVTACAVIFTKHTVYAALFFVSHLMCLAGIYALLNAPLIAVIQVMVYGGAVMVLFVFAIMILDANEELKLNPEEGAIKSLVWASVLGLALTGVFFGFANRFNIRDALAPAAPSATDLSLDNVASLGRMLYRDYLFTFELTGVLLLVAVVGIMVMAKRKLD